MRKKTLTKTIIIIALIVILFLATILMNRYLILPFRDYDTGMLIACINSPDNSQTADLHYLFKLGAPTLDGDEEILSEYTTIKIYDIDYDDYKYIYYSKGLIDLSDIFWIDDNRIKIGDVELNVASSVFDYRIHFWK